MVRTIAMLVAPAALALGTMGPAIGATPKAVSCQATAPIMQHFSTPRPWRWLGDCPNGRAEGLGVLRMGSEDELTMFIGRMHAGRPVAGLLDHGLLMMAKAFTPAGVAIQPDGNHPEEKTAVFTTARRAALATSRWLAARGNHASAAWYRDMADGIRETE
ncbi:hypothetical protein [Sphingomonas sp.]|uniref:hypothetical protein n=1 Tax=Sphingomonas sp. TaxID=28214 RepID=UPI003B3A930E